MILIIHQQEQYSAAGKVGITFVPRVCSQIFSFSCCCEALTDLWPHYISDLLHHYGPSVKWDRFAVCPRNKAKYGQAAFFFCITLTNCTLMSFFNVLSCVSCSNLFFLLLQKQISGTCFKCQTQLLLFSTENKHLAALTLDF